MTSAQYSDYRMSSLPFLGKIPSHWQERRLKTISPFISVGIVVNPSDYVSEEGRPFIYGGDIIEGRVLFETSRRISDEDSRKNSKTRLEAGDLLTVRVGAPGVTAVVPEACNGGNCASVMLVRKGDYRSTWLCYAMNSRMVRFQVEVVQYGAAQEQFNIGHAINFWVATPPRSEQEAIAAFLDRETAKIDALIAEQEKLIALLAEKRQATISHAVTKGLNPNAPMKDSGVAWLGEVPAHWEIGAVKRFFTSLDGRRVPLSAEERGGRRGEFPYYGASGVIDSIDDFIFDEDLVLVSEDGANLLNRSSPIAFVATGKYWVNNHAHILKPSDNNLRFWSERIEAIDLEPVVTGAAQPKLTIEALMNLPLSAPPTCDERAAIASFIEIEARKLDVLNEESRRAIALLKERRSALIAAAVTGQIDVRNAVKVAAP